MQENIQELFDEEKKLRDKGIADPQTAEVLRHMRVQKIQTLWDVQEAYDADFLGLRNRCHFGSRGLCCGHCLMGPCRLATDDFPFYLKSTIPSTNRSTCGKNTDQMTAGMFLEAVIRGTSAHMGQAIYTAKTLLKTSEGAKAYQIKDGHKLKNLSSRLGIKEAKSEAELAKSLAKLALEDLLGEKKEHLMSFAEVLLPKKCQSLKESNLMPFKGAAEQIVEANHAASHGALSNVDEMLNLIIRLGIIDIAALYIATEFQDILLGSPAPVAGKIGFDVLDKDKVNIVVHGHIPLLAEKIVDYAKKMEKEAKKAGAKGVNVAGLCCTGNEVLMRRGIPLVGSNLQQELVIGTGLVDAIVVDFQCIFPSLSEISKNFQTKLITTFPEGRMEEEIYIPFSVEKADESAAEMIRLAIEAYQNRVASKIFLPQNKSQTLLAGFTPENLLEVLKKLNQHDPFKPLVDLLKSGQIQGVALLASCTSPKVQSDMSYVTIARQLIKNNILVLTTGCAAQSLARYGLLSSEAAKEAGESLKKVLQNLGELAGLKAPLPPVLHFGSCVDNSRIVAFIRDLADYLGVSVDQLPVVASATEAVAEKAVAITTGAEAFGVTTHLGVVPPIIPNSSIIQKMGEKLAKHCGSSSMVVIDPELAAQALIEHIQNKRKKLGI